ncbi:MAG: hypothetical protein IJ770_02125 [Alphaproteobacteria bacterium]|nr:hypothetical protein [Alphaproteobacteria bacterium]
MTQESLFGKFMSLFSKPAVKHGGSTLSAAEAINMQNNYIAAICPTDMPISSPYPEIVKQLYSAKQEVFQAALYYLQKIAHNEPEQAHNISDELSRCISAKNKISQKNKELIVQAIANIAKFHNI